MRGLLVKKILMSLSILLLAYSTASFADQTTLYSSDISVKTPEVKVIAADKKSAVVSMELDNKSGTLVTIVAASSPVASETQLHETIDGKMVQVKSIKIPPNSDDNLQRNGFHVMLMDIKSPLEVNQMIPVTLIFSDGSDMLVNAKVE